MSHVILSGYTPRVHDDSLLPHLREKLDREIHKTALGAEDILDIRSCDDILSEVEILRKRGWQVVGLENNIKTEEIVSLSNKKFAERLSDKVVLVLGEEVHGISEELRERIELFLEIPMRGQKESFNVSVAAGIALFMLAFGR